jgi:REP element-mobilizing transposase RayT
MLAFFNMARPLRLEFEGAFYHAFSRGNERRDVFRDSHDREQFLDALGDCCERFRVRVHAYCLMSNHFHLLVETPEPNLSQFMKRLLGVYTIRFNRKHRRTGHLFQGRYKAIVVDKENYLLEVSRYIHLNPCRAKTKMVSEPELYPWSSLRHYLSLEAPAFLKRDAILKDFDPPERYLEFVRAGMAGPLRDPFQEAVGGALLGGSSFVEEMRRRSRSMAGAGIARHRELWRVPLERLEARLAGQDRDVMAYCWWRWGRLTQREIGQRLSLTDSAISHALGRIREKLRRDQVLRSKVEQLEEELSNFKN